MVRERGSRKVKISRNKKPREERLPFAELTLAGNGTNGRGSAAIVSIVTHVYNCLPAASKRAGIRRASASFVEEFRSSLPRNGHSFSLLLRVVSPIPSRPLPARFPRASIRPVCFNEYSRLADI